MLSTWIAEAIGPVDGNQLLNVTDQVLSRVPCGGCVANIQQARSRSIDKGEKEHFFVVVGGGG